MAGAEVNARGVDQVLPFYEQVFGWALKPSGSPDWLVYFTVDDVAQSFRKALDVGAREQLAPMDFPGGRMAIVSDPQGASFGLMQMTSN